MVKNKTFMTAIVSLAQEEQLEILLESQLELIGFLLKQNFDGDKIDSDHDDQITTLASKILSKKQPGKVTTNCLKVLGILTSQAIMTLSKSEEYFHRIADEKLVTHIAECYFAVPQCLVVLECLQKFIHPKIRRNGPLSHKNQSVFKTLKEEASAIFVAKKFITEESLLSRKWKTRGDQSQLDIYLQLLMECLDVSA